MRVNEDLLKRLKAGEEKAFEDLYWTYSPQVYNFINSLLFDKSLAEDLTQNVFLKIWEKHEQIELELGITAYLFTIARHLVFKGATMEEVAVMLDRLYNVKVRFASEKVKHYRFSGVIKNNSLDNVIELISLTAPIMYKKVGGEIIIEERK